MPLPDFTSEIIFPSFDALPLESDAPAYSPPPSNSRPHASNALTTSTPSAKPTAGLPPPYSESGPSHDGSSPGDDTTSPPSYSPETTTNTHFLLAQAKQNMTITKPTLVVTDRGGADFAITFEDRGIDLRPVKTGWTVVVPGASRVAPSVQGKKGFVRVPEGRGTGVHYLPATLDRVLELGAQLNEVGADGGRECVACGAETGEDGKALMRCTACGRVRYCSKVCQKKDWTEGGHKNDCKVFKAMAITWGS